MNAESTSTVDKLTIKLNQEIKKGDLLAILSSANYEIELIADSDGIIIELFLEEGQVLQKNDMMWKIKVI